MKRCVLLILTFFVLSMIQLIGIETDTFNQEGAPKIEENNSEYLSGLGFTAGKISGVGFAYRRYFAKSGVQFTFGLLSNADKVPSFSDESYSDTRTKTGWDVDGWLSFMYLRTIRESDDTRFYYFLGGSMNIDYSKKYTQNYENNIASGDPIKKIRNDNSYYFGPGIGLDFRVSKYISFIVELPISISSDKKIETYIPQGSIQVKF